MVSLFSSSSSLSKTLKPTVMLFLKTFSQAYLLFGAALVAASSADEEALELFQPKRDIVEFSTVGSAKYRKRDGSRVSLRMQEYTWVYAGQNKFQGHFRTAGDGFEFVVADFPIKDFPWRNTQWWARPTGSLAHGGRLGDGEYRILRRGLKTFGDPGSIEGWHWDLSPWFSVERGAAV
jgi:hypothetical protein